MSSITKGFLAVFVGIPQHQKGYLIYVPCTQKILALHDIVFDETFSSELAYTSSPYSDSLTIWPSLSYIPYTTLSHGQTGDIVIFSLFEEGGLVEN